MNYDIIEATSFEEVLSEIEENSKYKRLPPKEKNWMTVPEMGNLLVRVPSDSLHDALS